jgi:pimeloyl-ACP methyl ester carboxylesterase
MVIVGGENAPASTAGARIVEDRLPNATLVSIPGQRHVVHLTAPEMLAQQIIEFAPG